MDGDDRIMELRDALDVQQQGLEAAWAAVGPVTATHESGAVTVTLDAEGDVAAVTLSHGWQRHHHPEHLARAVTTVHGEAVGMRAVQALERWAADETVRRPRPVPLAPEPPGDEAAPVDFEAFLDLVDDCLADALDRLPDRVVARAYATSAGGHVQACVRAGGAVLEALDLDRRWLDRAPGFSIGREIAEAVRGAARASRELIDGRAVA